MKILLKYLIGIDVAKDKFDACLISLDNGLGIKVQSTHKFANAPAGFKEITAWIKKFCKEQIPVEILMEATGVYHEKLAIYLTEQKRKVFCSVAKQIPKVSSVLGP